MIAFSYADSSLLYAVGWALVHSLWQGALVALVVAIILHRIRARGDERESEYAYRTALGGLLALCGIVCMTAMIEYASADSSAKSSAMRPLLSIRGAVAHNDTEQSLQSGTMQSNTSQSGTIQSNQNNRTQQEALPPYTVLFQRLQAVQEAWQSFINEHLDFMVALWCSGVSVFLFKLILSTWYVRRLRREGVQPLPQAWQDRAQAIAEKIALSTPVAFVESALARVPMTIGIVKPMILFPIGMVAGLTPQQVEAILAHEMAHILRRDFAVNIVQSIIESMLFYHPAVWWLSGIINQEREHCCDDIALSVTGDSRAIATALAALVQHSSLVNPFSSSQFFPGKGGKNMLLHRIQRLLQSPVDVPRLHSGYFSAALILSVALMIVLGTNTQVQELVAKTSVAVKDAVVETITDPIGLTAERDKRSTKKEKDSLRATDVTVEATHTELSNLENDYDDISYDNVVFNSRRANRLDVNAEVTGEWAAEIRDEKRVVLRMNEPNDDIGYRLYNRYTLDKFRGLTAESFSKAGDVSFTLPRELGVFTLKGTSNGRGKAKGTYRFTADPTAVNALKAMGFSPVTDATLYDAALVGTKLKKFEEFKNMNLSMSHVTEFVVTGVKSSYVKDALAQGMKPDDIQAFGVVGISPAVATSFLSQGYTRNEAVEFGVRGLKPASVKEYKDAGFSSEETKELGARGIKPATANELKSAGFKGREIYELGVRGIKPATAKEFKEQGFSTDDAMDFAVRGIKPTTAKKFREAGFDDKDAMDYAVRGISPDKVQEYKKEGFSREETREYASRGIKPATAKKFREAGFDDKETMEYAVRGINPEKAQEYKKEGFSTRETMELGVRGIKPATAKQYKAQGFSSDETMELAVRGIRSDYASELRKIGLDADDIAAIGVRGVSVEWVREAKAMGFTSDEISTIGVRGISITKLKKLKDEGLSAKKIAEILSDW